MNLKRKFVNHVKAFMIPVALYLVVLLLIPERVGNLDSIISMLTLAVVPTMVSYGAHFGITSGLMDFSVGSRMILSGMVGCIGGYFFGPIGMIVGTVLTSLVLAAIIGGLFATLQIPSFVISLGCLMVFEVAGEYLAKLCNQVLPQLATTQYLKAPENMLVLGGAPFNFIVLGFVAILFELLNTRTKTANQARVVGSDELIARNVGIKPMKVKFNTYILGSVFLALASVQSACYSSAVGYAASMASMATVFKPMMSVIIGMSLGRLVRSCVGIFIGNLCLSVIFTGIIALGWPDSLQNVFLGIFLTVVLALPTIQRYLDSHKRRSAANKAHAGTSAMA
jgi:ribose transport system permease protein